MKSIDREKFYKDIKATALSVLSLIVFLAFWQIAAQILVWWGVSMFLIVFRVAWYRMS
jgi:hypothetical protein